MKEERRVSMVPFESISSVTVSSVAAHSPAQPPLPTPSPFSFSVASTRRSTRNIQRANLLLRFLALVLSFGSAVSLAAISPANTKLIEHSNNFRDFPDLLYCFITDVVAFIYAAYQLFKGICDITHRGIFISDMVSDYISFVADQVAGYLLISASSVAIAVIRQIHDRNSLRKAALTSVCMSFASFLIIATTALLSGYKLCKRVTW